MPRGLPAAGDRGLDNTHSWGRTYWGGAMFCLLADVQIRQHTHNRLGLQDALRAILKASGGLAADWPIERVLRTGDAAVGGTVLADLYARYKDAAVSPDLTAARCGSTTRRRWLRCAMPSCAHPQQTPLKRRPPPARRARSAARSRSTPCR